MNYNIFIIVSGINSLIVSTFVDDIKVIGIKESGHIERVKLELIAAFKMADIKPISFYLGLKIEKDRAKKILKLSYPTYIDKILVKYYFDQAKLYNTPMKERIPLLNKGLEASQTKQE